MADMISNGKTSDISSSLQNASRQAAATAHNGIDRASNAAQPVVEKVASTAHAAVDSLCETAEHAVDVFNEKSARIKEIHARSVEMARSHVRDSPLMAVGAATVVGYLLARILGSR